MCIRDRITEDSTHRFVTDVEKSNWNGKAPKDVATTSVNGLMAAADKVKLNGIANNANNYVHPDNSNTRHVTDSEKNKWKMCIRDSYLDTMTLTKARLDMINDGTQTTLALQDKIMASADRARMSYKAMGDNVARLNTVSYTHLIDKL